MTNKVLGMMRLATKAGKIVFGYEACKQYISKKKIYLLIIAKDASEKTKSNIKFLCNINNVQYIEYSNMEEISLSIGKKNKKMVGITDVNFSRKIQELISGGKVIG